MRVRCLQAQLQKDGLISQDHLTTLRGTRIGIDVAYWLRSLQGLKDPFAVALGGVPPAIFQAVNSELPCFKTHGIIPVFVFQGMSPTPNKAQMTTHVDLQMDKAWRLMAHGDRAEAQKNFATSTSRTNNEVVYFIFHHLKHMGYEVVQAPYLSGAQLAHFFEHRLVDLVYGPPGLMMYDIQRVVVSFDFHQQPTSFAWIELPCVLAKWQITQDQLVDACMLSGTEHCLSFPYLNNVKPVREAANFDAAIFIIKQAPLIDWMQMFPTQEMRNDHLHGYCICKVLVQSSPVFHAIEQEVRPLHSGRPSAVPRDISTLIGDKLPNSLYYLILQGVMGNELPQALATGSWIDASHHAITTKELGDLVTDLEEYWRLCVGLISVHLPENFKNKCITYRSPWDSPQRQQRRTPHASAAGVAAEWHGLKWKIHIDALQQEMARQGCEKVDFKFCLHWHAHDFQNEGQLWKDLGTTNARHHDDHPQAMAALVHFCLLEHLELISEDGGMTVLGNVLKDSPRHLVEPCLIALEMMKFGVLHGEPFEAACFGDPFPAEVNYPVAPVDSRIKSMLLLSRVFSLVPMKLHSQRWDADVNFDLTAFHSLVRVLNRALRQLTEAVLCSLLLGDVSKARLLPPGFMCASPVGADHFSTVASFPVFMLPRACMGIVCLYFLNYDGDASYFKRDLMASFPCCAQPETDLKDAMVFWEDLMRCMDDVAELLGAEHFMQDMKAANVLLQQRQRRLGIFPDAKNLRGDEHERVKNNVMSCGRGIMR